MKFGIENNDSIQCSGSKQAPKDKYEKLELLERGKRKIPSMQIETTIIGVFHIRR